MASPKTRYEKGLVLKDIMAINISNIFEYVVNNEVGIQWLPFPSDFICRKM